MLPLLAPFPSFPKALLNSLFSGQVRGGSPQGHCEPCSALPLWEWVHVQLESPSVLSFCVSFASLAYLMCSLILYRIFVFHPYSCQPLFSLRESLALDCLLDCQSAFVLFFFFFRSHALRLVTFFLTAKLQISLPLFSVSPNYSFTRLSLGSMYLSACWRFAANHWPANIWKLPLLEKNESSGPDREPMLVEHKKAKETTVDLLDFKPLSVFIKWEGDVLCSIVQMSLQNRQRQNK